MTCRKIDKCTWRHTEIEDGHAYCGKIGKNTTRKECKKCNDFEKS